MTRKHRSDGKKKRKRSDTPVAGTEASDPTYRVGPGRPPKEFQFKPGESGNPRGAKRKTSVAPDLKAILESALREKVRLRQGEREQIITKAAAGIAKLVNQFAEGDRHARRDLIALAETLGVDLTAGQGKLIESALAAGVTAEDEAIIADFLQRQGVNPEHRANDIAVAFNENDSKQSILNPTAEKPS
jgi:Family of unknown function (DUF5681)